MPVDFYPNGEPIEGTADTPAAPVTVPKRTSVLTYAIRALAVALASGDGDPQAQFNKGWNAPAVVLQEPVPGNRKDAPEHQQLDCEPTSEVRVRRVRRKQAA
jgi:hypothetical protein